MLTYPYLTTALHARINLILTRSLQQKLQFRSKAVIILRLGLIGLFKSTGLGYTLTVNHCHQQ